MPRPQTKSELITKSEGNFSLLFGCIDSLSEQEQLSPFTFEEDRDQNIRDVLIHLYEWHNLLRVWIHKNKDGEKSSFFPKPYNFKNYPELNKEFWKRHQNTSLSQAKDLLCESHQKVMNLIKDFSEKELFTKHYFSWTGSTHLASYCISSTSSHYDWALKKIRKHSRSLKK